MEESRFTLNGALLIKTDDVAGVKAALGERKEELEIKMGFPREYLDFTTWYLKNKKYITRSDNSDFNLTAEGVDFIEANYVSTPMLQKLLASGVETVTGFRDPNVEGYSERLFEVPAAEIFHEDAGAA